MPVIYELRDEDDSALAFHPTMAAAEREQDWWTKDGIETTIHHIHYNSNTRAGIADLLNRLFGQQSTKKEN